MYNTIQQCHKVIHRVAGQLVQEKKAKIIQGQIEGIPYAGRDLLSLLSEHNEPFVVYHLTMTFNSEIERVYRSSPGTAYFGRGYPSQCEHLYVCRIGHLIPQPHLDAFSACSAPFFPRSTSVGVALSATIYSTRKSH